VSLHCTDLTWLCFDGFCALDIIQVDEFGFLYSFSSKSRLINRNDRHIEVEIPSIINLNNIGRFIDEIIYVLNQSRVSADFLPRKLVNLETVLMFIEEVKVHIQSGRCFLDQGIIPLQDRMKEI
jgi:hypothetical protein